MKLCEHEDFGPILTETTAWLKEQHGLERISARIVEKDYYVTQVLRAIATNFSGTSPVQHITKTIPKFLLRS